MYRNLAVAVSVAALAVVLHIPAAAQAAQSAAQPSESSESHDSCDAMSGATGMMEESGEMGSGMMGMGGHASTAEAPWISLALRHRQELGLSADQIGKLEALRSAFAKQSIRQSADIRVAELELTELLDADPVELPKVQSKLRQVESLKTELRLARIRTLEQGKALLTTEQRAQLKTRIADAAMDSHATGADDGGIAAMHDFMRSERMPQAMSGMMDMAARMGNGDPMTGMVRMMEMMGSRGGMMGGADMMPKLKTDQ